MTRKQLLLLSAFVVTMTSAWCCRSELAHVYASASSGATDAATKNATNVASGGAGVAALSASAGPDATLTYNTATALAGSASGGTAPYTYAWTTVGRSYETAETVADATSATSNITLDGPNGTITKRLTVTDAAGHTAYDDVVLTLNATVANVLGANLAYRWSANDLADGAVSSWANSVGGSSALVQATGGKQPTRSATALDGYPGVTSDGARVLTATLSTPLAAASRPYYFVVTKPTATGVAHGQAVATLMKTGGASSWIEAYIGNNAGGNKVSQYRVDSSGAADTNKQVVRLVPQVLHGGFTSGGTNGIGCDNAQCNSTATGTVVAANAIDQLWLFAENATPTVTMTGVISDVLVCTSVPTQRQIEAVLAILYTAWGISRAPARAWTVLATDIDAALPIDVEWEGAFGDGRFVYYTPVYATDKMLRFDSYKRTDDISAWTVRTLPAGGDGQYLGGGTFDGRYIYIANGHFWFRYDTTRPPADFTNDANWQSFDLRTVTNSGTGYDYQWPFYDGVRYIYLPHTDYSDGDGSSHGKRILQYDTQAAAFTTAGSYLASPDTSVSLSASGWAGGGADSTGRYVFFSNTFANPRTGYKLRYDSNAGLFSNAAAWSSYDTSAINAGYVGYNDAKAADDGYVYYSHGELTFGASDGHYILRHTIGGTWSSGWEVFNTSTLAADAATGAYGMNPGMSTDGRRIAFPGEHAHGFWLLDTQAAAFTTATSYDYYDSVNYNLTPNADGSHRKHAGACFMNGALYLAPVFNNGHLLRVWMPN